MLDEPQAGKDTAIVSKHDISDDHEDNDNSNGIDHEFEQEADDDGDTIRNEDETSDTNMEIVKDSHVNNQCGTNDASESPANEQEEKETSKSKTKVVSEYNLCKRSGNQYGHRFVNRMDELSDTKTSCDEKYKY